MSITLRALPFRSSQTPLREVNVSFTDEKELLAQYQTLALSLDDLFAQIFFAYNRYLSVYLRRRGWSRPAVEDLLQSAWFILWRDLKRGSFFQRHTEPATAKPMLAFLAKTCENLARNLRRHETSFPSVPLEELDMTNLVHDAKASANDMEKQINLQDLHRITITACSDDERRVLDLLALGLDRCEIAEIVGQKPHWVDNRRRAAFQKIRVALARRQIK